MNFLPPEDQIIIKRQYKFKFIFFLGIIISFLAFVNLIFIFPSYIFLKIKNEDFKKQFGIISASREFKSLSDTESSLKKINDDIDFLKNSGDKSFIFSNLLKEITDLKESGISITSISFDNSDKSFSILGNAGARDDLMLFVKKIKDSGKFETVEFPPSNILKNEDIDYSIKAVLK